jgi:hypothetical protein
VRVSLGITHTIGGLRIDEQARVVGADGLFAAGADVGASRRAATRAVSPWLPSSAASAPSVRSTACSDPRRTRHSCVPVPGTGTTPGMRQRKRDR